MRARSVGIVLALLAGTSAAAAQTRSRPNILFLMADEYRHDCLGVEGHPFVKTPNLDRLARQGVRFRQAYAASPVCSPARATLFTGRYPQVHGVVSNGMALRDGEVALPQLLRRHGYACAMAGKLHLPPDDWFDPAWITAGGSGEAYLAFLRARIPGWSGRSNTAAREGTLIGPPRTPLRIGTSVLPESLFEEAWVADRAIDFLRSRKASGEPWFLFVSMLKPHSEFVIPEPYATMYRPSAMPLPSTFRAGAPRPEPQGLDRNERLFIDDPEVLREVIAHYYGAVNLVDVSMGRVLETLEELGMARDTIVVFTADHGNMLGERNRMFKGVMYESSARVPLLVRAPGKLPQEVVSNKVLDTTSVLPTLLELAGIPIPDGVQGRSLVEEARRPSGPTGRAFSVLHHRMVRIGAWKLIDPYDDPRAKPELYDLQADPNEQTNHYGAPSAAARQHELETALAAWWRERPKPVRLDPPPAR